MSLRAFYGTVVFPLIAIGMASADLRPGGAHPDVARLPKEAAQRYADTTLFPRPTRWLEIPWMLDLEEGLRVARQENRPILIWVSGDDPLERC